MVSEKAIDTQGATQLQEDSHQLETPPKQLENKVLSLTACFL
jgi:hypothetical protein